MMMPPYSSSQAQTRSRNASRPTSWRLSPSLRELPLDHDLRADAGVVVARLPEGVEAAHAVPADEDVLQRAVEGVAHVQGAGDVRGRHGDDVGRTRIIRVGLEKALTLPCLLPALLDELRPVQRLHRSHSVHNGAAAGLSVASGA